MLTPHMRFASRFSAVLAFALMPSEPLTAQSLRVTVRASEASNFLYQLDCVSEAIAPCGRTDFSALWEAELLRSKADSNALAEWRRLRARYQRYVAIDSQGTPRGLDLGEGIRIAGFQSESVDAFLLRLDLLVLPEDRARWSRAARHFWPMFDRWWQREAASGLQRFADSTRALLERDAIRRQLGDFAAFYHAELPANDSVTMTLIVRPNLVRASLSGQQIGNYSVVEFLPGESPTRRLSVVLHELAHFIFRQAPEYDGLRSRFVAVGGKGAMAAYNLLNEGLATIFGNGMIERSMRSPESWQRYRSTPRSFYNNPSIDTIAKGLLSWMDSVVTRRGTLYDSAWVPEYVARVSALLGKDIDSPRLQLGESFVFVDDALGASRRIRDAARSTLGIASLYGSSAPMRSFSPAMIARPPGLAGIMVIAAPGVSVLARHKLIDARSAAAIGSAARAGSVLFVVQQASGAPLYLIVARDVVGAERELKRLAALPTVQPGIVR
ncbi:MAG: hypothetical protein V4550_21250 [Gemmatimonadota bacterium]